MLLSHRLTTLGEFIPTCECLADIGTDHGYIPIYALQHGIAKRAIASDIKKGPVEIAKKNIHEHGLSTQIETRLGPGLQTLGMNECDVIVISGMGGNLISDILTEGASIAKSTKHLILLPVQYPEELRRFLVNHGYSIMDETMAREGNKFYPILHVIHKPDSVCEYEKEVYYYTGKCMLETKHPILYQYIGHKLSRLSIILKELEHTKEQQRKLEVLQLIKEFEEVKACLDNAVK